MFKSLSVLLFWMSDEAIAVLFSLQKCLKNILEVLDSLTNEDRIISFRDQVDHAILIVEGTIRLIQEPVVEESEFLRRRAQQLGRTRGNLHALALSDLEQLQEMVRHFTEVHALLIQYTSSFPERAKQRRQMSVVDDKRWQLMQLAYLGYVQMEEEIKEEAFSLLESALGQFFVFTKKYVAFGNFFR